MDNGVYIMLSRQTAMFRKMNTVANNIANSNTTGFQAEKMMFTDYLIDDGNRNKMAFTQDIASYHEEAEGSMQVTGGQLDMAISGDGYFTIELPNGGRAYTRAGNFQVDGNGVLTTAEGLPVLDNGGQRIQMEQEDRNIRVGEDGLLMVDNQERAVIGVVEFPNPQTLEHMSGSMMRADGQAPGVAINSRVLHGVLEESNVVAVQEIVEMTKTSRGVSNTAKFIEVMYDLQRKAHNVYTQQS
jgi:flagellar basal-body rod protein FlgF